MKNKIIYSFDDTHELNDKLFDLLQKYGVKAIWFLDFRDPKMAEEQIKKYYKAGHEIGNHTINHELLTRVPLETAQNTILEATERIEKLIGKKPKWFCPPRGYVNDNINKIARACGHTRRRLTTTDYWVHIYPRPEYNGKKPFEEAEYRIIDRGRVHIWGHSWEINKFNYWEMFEDFLKNNVK